jgi:hypothetical protein
VKTIVVLSLLLGAAQCTSTIPETLDGTWGGAHIGMVVTAASTELEFDCAHGRIDRPRPARYAGRARGDAMTLRVTLTDSATTIGTFELERGASPSVFKCL